MDETMALIKAGSVVVGAELAERDGFVWNVVEIIKQTEKTITFRMASDFSSFREHWTTGPGVVKTFRKTSYLSGNLPESK